MRSVGKSLAGRASYLVLHPLTEREKTNRTAAHAWTPKLFAGDTGLGLFLADVDDEEHLKLEINAGAWLENLVLDDLLFYRETEIKKPNVFYRRTVTGEEIDFVVERGRRLLPIEIKASSTVRVDDARLLDDWCREFGKRSPFGVLLYDGKEPIRLTDDHCRAAGVVL